jgi:hypothetical protein
MRVQIPAYTDRWMMGDRYGEIIRTTTVSRTSGDKVVMAHVKLDKSGKTLAFVLDDCTVVEKGPALLTAILNGRA